MARLTAALEPDYVVLGGGNVHKLKRCPRVAGRAITRIRSAEGFACGRRPANGGLLLPKHQRQLKDKQTSGKAIS